MVIDTSALLAILFGEAETPRLVQAISTDSKRWVGAPTVVEAVAVMLARTGRSGDYVLDALLQRLGMEVVPMTPEASALARSAYARYGKGVGSPGVLNLGDCLAYGVAKALGEPLLFKGNDFSRTDVEAVPY